MRRVPDSAFTQPSQVCSEEDVPCKSNSGRPRPVHIELPLDVITADADHVLLRGAGAGPLEHVPGALARDRRGDRPHHVVVAATAPHHVAQADRVIVAQARVQGSGRREPQAIAGVRNFMFKILLVRE